MPFDPTFQQRVDFCEIRFVLGVEAVKEVIVLAAGYELLKRFGAILRQRERFPKEISCAELSVVNVISVINVSTRIVLNKRIIAASKS